MFTIEHGKSVFEEQILWEKFGFLISIRKRFDNRENVGYGIQES